MKKLRTKMTLMLVLGLLVVGGASAVIVGYLSNEAQVNVEVKSPVLLEVSDDSTNGNDGTWKSEPATLDFSVYGGESVTFWVKDTNLASVAIAGSSTKLVSCDTGATCNDFASVMADGNDLLLLPGGCVGINSTTVNFSAYTSGGLDAGEVNINEIVATFKPGALGTYVFTMQKMIP